MAVLVGIDEAGFGPILGPLVVSSTAFSIGEEKPGADLWQVLRRSVSTSGRHLAGRVLITDSKKAYNRKKGVKHLERATLACLQSLGKEPATVSELLSVLSPDSLQRLKVYPWYRNITEHKILADKTDIGIASSMLGQDMFSNGLDLLGLKSRCLDVAHYNRLVSASRNKASVLFAATSELIQKALEDFGQRQLQIIVDRHGGRMRYQRLLQRSFSGMDLKIISENSKSSSYELKSKDKKMRVHFAVGADKRYLPVSLASMVSKYVRELLVENINRYFAGHYGQLKPTAGYWKDGLRFIEDLKRYIPNVQYESNQLIRCR